MNSYSIKDLEKAIAYAKKQNAVVITLEVESHNNARLKIGVAESYKGAYTTINVYVAESAKMPTITKEETLFE